VGAYGYILFCLTLNDLIILGPRLLGHLPSTGDPPSWLPGAWARVEPRHWEELDRVDRW
jgi:hypothetical protein